MDLDLQELGLVVGVAPIVSPLEGATCGVLILNYDPTTHTMETTSALISCD
jgi:hypothetical protein